MLDAKSHDAVTSETAKQDRAGADQTVCLSNFASTKWPHSSGAAETSSDLPRTVFLKVAAMRSVVAFRSVIDHTQKLVRVELSADLA